MRLDILLDMIPSCRCLADIGTDHGLLPAMALSSGKARNVLCCDISTASLDKARAKLGGDSRASFRCMDGVADLRRGEADVVVITGMGGHTIAKILRNAPEGILDDAQILLGAHSALPHLRQSLEALGYSIDEERIAREDRRYYLLMRVKKGQMRLTEKQQILGRFVPWPEDAFGMDYLRWLYTRTLREADASGDECKRKMARYMEEMLR